MRIIRWILFSTSAVTSIILIISFGWRGLGASLPIWVAAFTLSQWLVVVPANQILVTETSFTRKVLHLHQPGWHLVKSPFEQPRAWLSTLPQIVEETSREVRSSDRIPFLVEWTLIFQICLDGVESEQLTTVVTFLAGGARQLATFNVEDALRGVFDGISSLTFINRTERVVLTRSIREEARSKLVPLGVRPLRLVLRRITPPADLQANIVEGVSRLVGARTDRTVLPSLAGIGREMNAQEKHWVLDLEERRILAHPDNAVIYERNGRRSE